ncbi:hypothetical protein NDA10_005209 [Ustilago hordei]|nr:hypothetical protein NDA10_005209 [Ustilago hordei]
MDTVTRYYGMHSPWVQKLIDQMSNQGAEDVECVTVIRCWSTDDGPGLSLTLWNTSSKYLRVPPLPVVALMPQYVYSSEAIPSEATDGARATGSIGKCGKYFTTGPGGIEFTVEAYIGSDMVDPPVIVEISDPRDITAALGASYKIEVADLGVVYDDDSKFTTRYGVSYVSLGIPTEVMDMLIDAINADFSEHDWARGASACEVPKLQTHDGYSWLPVKIPKELPGCVRTKGQFVKVPDVPRFIRDQGKSIMCNAFVSMRLKRVTKTSIRNAAQWELAMTVSYVQVIDFTTKQSPPFYNMLSFKGRNRDATDDVIATINEC